MTTFAFGLRMLIAQPKADIFVVIETGFFPRYFCMTLFALAAQALFVCIIFLMTCITSGRCFLFIKWPTMTLLAACFMVFSEQAETGIHIVAKCQFVPGALFVTTFATLHEVTLMLIVLTVTTLTVTRSICVALVDMTLIAEHYFVCVTEYVLGL